MRSRSVRCMFQTIVLYCLLDYHVFMHLGLGIRLYIIYKLYITCVYIHMYTYVSSYKQTCDVITIVLSCVYVSRVRDMTV